MFSRKGSTVRYYSPVGPTMSIVVHEQVVPMLYDRTCELFWREVAHHHSDILIEVDRRNELIVS
jgi:hypothetical protein